MATERHIINSSDVDSIELDTNSSNVKTERRKSAIRNGNDEIQSAANCQKIDSNDSLQQSMALEALENTKLAVAQFTAAALSKGVNESSVKDLTMLQSALFTLQHQQVFQMQLIEQLQYQLAKTNARKDKKGKNPESKSKIDEKDEHFDLNHTSAEDENDMKSSSGEW